MKPETKGKSGFAFLREIPLNLFNQTSQFLFKPWHRKIDFGTVIVYL